jgi:hypothetical protein
VKLASPLVAVVAALHLLLALANFGLASEEEAALSVPLVEGALSLVAAIALAAAAVLLFRGRLFRGCVVALAGTASLPILFAFTVPEHSDRLFLFASLVVPLLSAATAFVSGRRRRNLASSL